MSHAFYDIAFTPSVKAEQDQAGSRSHYEKHAARTDEVQNSKIDRPEAQFLSEADSLYLATVSETGWPYVQHRGGPVGFIKVIGETRIGWAEFSGNRQYISTGNLKKDDRVSLFIMDYANKRRLKLFGHARFVGQDATEISQLQDEGYRARVERGMIVEIAGFEWNCPQHITPMYRQEEVKAALVQMGARIAELEAELERKA